MKKRMMNNINPSHFSSSYIGKREDILNLIPSDSKNVLDVGCSTGTLGEQIKQKTGSFVAGIEMDKDMAAVAKVKLDSVIIGDVETIDLKASFQTQCFDCIVFGDILEHLKDPWNLLKKFQKVLKPAGIIVASIPNVRHYSTIMNLLFLGRWTYRERGIHDKTHLRFFTYQSIKEMFADIEFEIFRVERNYRIIENAQHSFARYFALPGIKDFLTFQYIVAAKKSPLNENKLSVFYI